MNVKTLELNREKLLKPKLKQKQAKRNSTTSKIGSTKSLPHNIVGRNFALPYLTPEFHLTNTINFHSRRRRLHQQQQQQMVSMDPQQWWEEHHLKQVVLELNWLL